ncbi:NHLP leader peptide family RiPP precursor [aff. Roholtiella sp. LEGE 12411]|uniref:NHLP leader peptide family RiPP precursor n=1 Tax=aff. Roholtiella sp. LEGE 12411 TaxID=1828822 RepID=UPI0018808275|nr:NHLP leader peptide family RiPP precursor [aff. Roholtiella sp. LEGE 12411]MBE9036791.1 NHLP leader peptide family RiPP precursor [aff. Roholtiella sp. LEGE 12411]
MNNQDKTPEGITPLLPLWSYQLQQDSKLAVKTRKDLEIHLITRALKDEGFRQELIANPKAVVEKELGTKLPEELEINVLEETEDTLYMVLPYNPYEGISEEDLKALVGMTYEDVARWLLDQQRNALLDEESSVTVMARAWRDDGFKQELITNPVKVIEEELGGKIQEQLQDIQLQVITETVNSLFIVQPQGLTFPECTIHELDRINMPMIVGSGSPTMGSNDVLCNTIRGTNCFPPPPPPPPCPGFGTFCILTLF